MTGGRRSLGRDGPGNGRRRGPPDRAVARVLRQVREQQGLTLEQVAARLGMTAAGYAHWEHARARVLPADFPRLERALGVPPGYLAARMSVTATLAAQSAEADEEADELTQIAAVVDATHHLPESFKHTIRSLLEAGRREILGPVPGCSCAHCRALRGSRGPGAGSPAPDAP